jgi:hypothetical protein
MSFPLTYVTLKAFLNNNKTILTKNISTIDPSNFTMVLSSLCGFRIKINAEIYDRPKNYDENKIKVNFYSYCSIIASILYLIGTLTLTYSMNENENAISGVSIECYCQNIAWHAYVG